MPKALSEELVKLLAEKDSEDKKRKGGNTGDSNILKLNNGLQTLRIVKPKDGDFLRRAWLHYGFGRPFMCAKKNFDDECPACKLASALYKESTPESLKVSKRLYSKEYYFSPVIVRERPQDGAKWWSYNQEFHADLKEKLRNPQYGDITDIDEGTDILVTKKTPEETGTQFGRVVKEYNRTVSKLAETAEECEKILNSVVDFHQVFSRKSTEEIQSIVDKYMTKAEVPPSEENEASAPTDETTQYGTKPAVEKTGNPDIDAAFASIEDSE